MANSEASENVQFLNSLERFQFPLYGNVHQIKYAINPLFGALRKIYKTSTFYNTSNSMASFLSKCTNHLTECCHNFISNGKAANLFLQPPGELLGKILVCLDLLRAFRLAYEDAMIAMDASGEPTWDFSENYVFGQSIQLAARLSKVFFYYRIKLTVIFTKKNPYFFMYSGE